MFSCIIKSRKLFGSGSISTMLYHAMTWVRTDTQSLLYCSYYCSSIQGPKVCVNLYCLFLIFAKCIHINCPTRSRICCYWLVFVFASPVLSARWFQIQSPRHQHPRPLLPSLDLGIALAHLHRHQYSPLLYPLCLHLLLHFHQLLPLRLCSPQVLCFLPLLPSKLQCAA